jgi:hypothetical protein
VLNATGFFIEIVFVPPPAPAPLPVAAAAPAQQDRPVAQPEAGEMRSEGEEQDATQEPVRPLLPRQGDAPEPLLELGPLPDVEGPEGEPVPGVPSDSEGEPESVPNQSQEEPVSESLGPLPEAAPGPPVSESLGPLPEESLGPLPGEYAGEQLKAHTMKPEPDAQDELPGKAIGLQKRDTSNASRSS